MIFQQQLNEAREAAEKLDEVVLMVQGLAKKEPQEYPTRYRISELRRISRTLAQCETALQELYS
jgi:hypothetical protein